MNPRMIEIDMIDDHLVMKNVGENLRRNLDGVCIKEVTSLIGKME